MYPSQGAKFRLAPRLQIDHSLVFFSSDAVLQQIGAQRGSTIKIIGNQETVAIAMVQNTTNNQNNNNANDIVHVNPSVITNSGVEAGRSVLILAADDVPIADIITFLPYRDTMHHTSHITEAILFEKYLRPFFRDTYRPVSSGDRILCQSARSIPPSIEFKVTTVIASSSSSSSLSSSIGIVGPTTILSCSEPTFREDDNRSHITGHLGQNGLRRFIHLNPKMKLQVVAPSSPLSPSSSSEQTTCSVHPSVLKKLELGFSDVILLQGKKDIIVNIKPDPLIDPNHIILHQISRRNSRSPCGSWVSVQKLNKFVYCQRVCILPLATPSTSLVLSQLSSSLPTTSSTSPMSSSSILASTSPASDPLLFALSTSPPASETTPSSEIVSPLSEPQTITPSSSSSWSSPPLPVTSLAAPTNEELFGKEVTLPFFRHQYCPITTGDIFSAYHGSTLVEFKIIQMEPATHCMICPSSRIYCEGEPTSQAADEQIELY